MTSLSRRIATLIVKYLRDDLTQEQAMELNNWIDQSEENRLLFERLIHEDSLKEDLRENAHVKQKVWTLIKKEIEKEKTVPVHHVIPWKYVAAAVAIIAVVMSGVYLWFDSKPAKAIAQTPASASPLTLADIKPGGNKAILTLGDGSTIVLDNMQNGVIATEKGANVVKHDGKIEYHGSDSFSEAGINNNTISTPRGGRHHLVLSDGTQVWLNAASSISYPVSFTSTERTVSITGEAYFEVNPILASRGGGKVPFTVKIMSASGEERGEVKVLGTHFNINAYGQDGEGIQTTLLEGSVKVQSPAANRESASTVIRPNQQAVITSTNQLHTVNNVRVDEVMSWKNGLFHFTSAPIEKIMWQASLVYDIDIVYQKKITDKFSGKISRNVSLADFLKILQLSEVKFSLEKGRTLVITE